MENKSLDKFKILAQTIINTAGLYKEAEVANNETQKGLLETLIGAGIWYLPSGKDLYSGFISSAALESLQLNPRTKLVEEHPYPRKVAGRDCYSRYLDEIKANPVHFYELFKTKFGIWNYVLQSENKRLTKYAKTHNFIDWQTSYDQAGIHLVEFPMSEINRLRNVN